MDENFPLEANSSEEMTVNNYATDGAAAAIPVADSARSVASPAVTVSAAIPPRNVTSPAVPVARSIVPAPSVSVSEAFDLLMSYINPLSKIFSSIIRYFTI